MAEKEKMDRIYYQAIFENTGTATVILARDTTIKLANKKFVALSGYSREELEGKKSWTGFVHEDDLEWMRSQHELRRINPDEAEKNYAFRFVNREGHIRNVQLTVDMIPGNDDSVASILDITDYKKVMLELSREQNLLESLLDNIPDTIYFKDRESRFIKINKAQVRVLGLNSAAEAIGKTDFDFFDNIHACKAHRDEQKIIKSGKPVVSKQEKITLSNGSVQWFSTSKVPLKDDKGNIKGIVGISRNITRQKLMEEERKKLEKQVHDAQKMESLMLMAGNIAHNFNNILTIVLGNLELIELDPNADPDLHSKVSEIRKAARKAADLSKLMLIYVGQGQINLIKFNLNVVVKNMLPDLSSQLPANQQIEFIKSADALPILVDEDYIRQMISVIVTNAREAIGDKKQGKITIKCGRKHLNSDYFRQSLFEKEMIAGTYAYLEITDNGSGMDKKTRDKVFDPFFSTKFPGRGLGLAAVFGIVRAHKGAVLIDSTAGKGTRVEIIMPLKKA